MVRVIDFPRYERCCPEKVYYYRLMSNLCFLTFHLNFFPDHSEIKKYLLYCNTHCVVCMNFLTRKFITARLQCNIIMIQTSKLLSLIPSQPHCLRGGEGRGRWAV